MRVLILGGTAEARLLAAQLDERGYDVTTSLAGRTDHPSLPAGQLRVGGYGPGGLAEYLWTESFEQLIDATHAFSVTISATAVEAARETGVPLIRLQRPGWKATDGDDWRRVPDLAAAAAYVAKSPAGMVFLTTGRRGLSAFAADSGHDFLLRMATEPDEALPPRSQLIVSRGPFTLPEEKALLDEHQVRLLVTKDSGGDATEPKLTAARELGLPVVMIDRPSVPQADTIVASVAEVLLVI